MQSTENITFGDGKFQALLESFLRLRARNEFQNVGNHLDEDTLTAFTEGNLAIREADPVVLHLADCSFCRHKTTEFVRLDLALAEIPVDRNAVESTQPAKVSEVLNGILARIFGSGAQAVTAHEEKPESKDDDAPESGSDESDGDKKNVD